MLRQTYTPEHARAGVTKESVDAANDRIDQAAQANYQQITAQLPTLRAQAAELLAVLVTGPGAGELQQAIGWADTATDAPHIAGAVQALRSAIERWAYDASLVRDLNRLAAPALAQQAAQQRAVDRRTKALTIEERLDRVEKHLGL